MQQLKSLLTKIRGARGIEWIALIIVVAVALMLASQNAGTGGSGQPTELESRMERVLSAVAGAGQVRVMINEEVAVSAFSSSTSAGPKVLGVLVVAEGADDLRVAMELSRAVQALTGIELSAIEVMEMEKEE